MTADAGVDRPEKAERAARITCALGMRGVAVVRRPDGNLGVAMAPIAGAPPVPRHLIERFMLASSTIAALAARDRCVLCGPWMGHHHRIPGFLRPLLGIGLTVHTACEAAVAIERVRRACRPRRVIALHSMRSISTGAPGCLAYHGRSTEGPARLRSGRPTPIGTPALPRLSRRRPGTAS